MTKETAAKPNLKTQHDYELLNGASGRAVFFRPQRFTAQELLPLRFKVIARHDGTDIAVKLYDLSQGGIGLLVADGQSGPAIGTAVIGTEIHDLHVRAGRLDIYRGRATIVTTRQIKEGTLLGTELLDGMVQMDDLRSAQVIERWNVEHNRPLRVAGSPWATAGHAPFKAALLELRVFLDDAKVHLAALEDELPWDVLHGDGDSLAQRAMVEVVDREFKDEFVNRNNQLFELIADVSKADSAPLVALSRHVLDPYFMEAPWMHRARFKPLGYAGDYEIMNHIYRRGFDGPTLFAKALHYAGLHSPAGFAVHNRKNMSRRDIANLIIRGSPGGGPVKVLSVAAGPAEEIFELLRDAEDLANPVSILLFDQDAGALSYAHARLQPLVERRWAGQVTIGYLHDSIKRLIKDPKLFRQFGPFDAIICAGLYDYLQKPTAVRLSRNLFGLLREGGFLNIGNMVHGSRSRWLMEHMLDWWLLYRSHDEMIEFATEADSAADVVLRTEATGVNPFVVMHRR